MRARLLDMLAPGLVAAIFGVLLIQWLGSGPGHDLAARVPGLDRPAGSAAGPALPQASPVAGTPVRSDGQPAEVSGQWPWFRGPERDGICRDDTRLARSWPPNGPPVLWSIELGEGYASAAIAHGGVYVLDYDETAQADTMRCLSLDDGREIWRNGYPVQATRNHGISRTVPAVVGDRVISLGPRCHVACWDARTGQCHWLIDLAGQHGAVVPALVRGAVPAGRSGPRHSGPWRQGAADRRGLQNGGRGVGKPQPPRVGDDALVDCPHGLSGPSHVCLLRQRRSRWHRRR